MGEMLSRPTILLVDDDANVVRAFDRALRHAGYNVFTASDGVEALSMLEAEGESILVVVLDMMMPGMNGLAVVRHLLNVHRHPVGVVAISGYSEVINSSKDFFSLGTDVVLTTQLIAKPFDFPRLQAEIERTVELVRGKRTASTRNSVASIGDRLTDLERQLEAIDRKLPSFLTQLGLDLVRVVILGAAIIALLFFGLADLLRGVLGM